MLVVREACRHLGLPLAGARVAVQGFGNVGSIAAQHLAREGARIVAVNDVKGGVHNPAGLDIERVVDHTLSTGSIAGFPGGRPLADSIVEYDCDILIPAALENVITLANVERVRARVVAEGANGPTTHDADRLLAERKVFVIPDILANAGGVTVSYFEWVQNNAGFYWSEQEVHQRLEQYLVKAFHDVLRISLEYGVNMRVAAFMLAIKRVVDVIQFRGVHA
jgi:glutamate dehydrogenase/leucine dehydrogenase